MVDCTRRPTARPPSSELYDLEKDPGERRSVADRHPEVVARFEERLRRWKAGRPTLASRAAPPVEIDEHAQERLRALGYLN